MLTQLLGDVPAQTFFTQHFGVEPLLMRGTAAWAAPLATAAVFERLLEDPRADVLLARDGKPHERPASLERARALFADGYTWVVRSAERVDADLAEAGRKLASDVHGVLQIQLYRTPAARQGFGWHFDAEEVFYLQGAGRKRFRLRRNTQHPSPLLHAMPEQLSAEHETTPISEHVLEPGDCLYIPSGFWHVADALEETASISIGVLAPCPLDALGLVLRELAADPHWRARLPSIGGASPVPEAERAPLWSRNLEPLQAEVQRRLGAPDFALRLFAQTGWWQHR
jgi:50S ribosomal protein L16 3-hydroxylase